MVRILEFPQVQASEQVLVPLSPTFARLVQEGLMLVHGDVVLQVDLGKEPVVEARTWDLTNRRNLFVDGAARLRCGRFHKCSMKKSMATERIFLRIDGRGIFRLRVGDDRGPLIAVQVRSSEC